MRLLLLVFFCLPLCTQAQNTTLFAAARAGLSMRETPATSAKILQKIAYGQKLVTVKDEAELQKISTEGFDGYWQKVSFNNQVGYVVSSYLLPFTPPKAGITNLKPFLGQISIAIGTPLLVKTGAMQNIEDGGTELKKQLYKNGAEWQEYTAYEYNEESFFLPNLSVEQAYLVVRLTGAYPTEVGEKDAFPAVSTEIKMPMGNKIITVQRANFGQGIKGPVERIKIETEEGPISSLEIFILNGQAVISWSSGV